MMTLLDIGGIPIAIDVIIIFLIILGMALAFALFFWLFSIADCEGGIKRC